jgi:ABC-type branched-subunit amino acid transport system permease subunit
MEADSVLLVEICHNCINRQIFFDGLVQGLVYGLLAMGIVLIYRSTRVINFAVGGMGIPGAALFVLLVVQWGTPLWVALVASIAAGAAIAAVVELIVVRRLFRSPRVILLVATIGVAQLMQLFVVALPDVDDPSARFPVAVSRLFEPFDGLRVSGPKLTILVVVPVAAAVLAWVLNRTTFGKAVAASADNPDLGRLSGVNPKVVSTFVWIIAGVLSTLSMILLSGGGSVTGVSNLGPLTLARALAAAVIAGMVSFPRAVLAGVVIGIVEGVLRFNVLDEPGLIDFVLFLAVLVAVYVQSRGESEGTLAAFTPKVRAVPVRLRAVWYVRNLSRIAIWSLFALAVAIPLVHNFRSSQLFLYSTIVAIAICAVSVTVITGWSGQLSLAQMAFAGLGALTAAALARGVEMDIGWRSTRILDFQLDPIPFGVALLLAPLATGLLAALIGIGALRVRGLLLAVSTFALAIAAQQYVYRRPFFSNGETSVLFERGSLLGLDISDQRTYLYVCLGGLAIVLAIVARLRHSGIGRTTIAVRDNADAAAAYTVSPTRTKLTAFALAGTIAGFGGALIGGLVRNIRYSDTFFLVSDSLRLVAIVVIGGLGSLFGAVLGAVWVVGLPAFWPDNEIIPLFTSSIGLLLVLMYFPGGLAQIAYAARDALLDRVDRVNRVNPRTARPGPEGQPTALPLSVRRTERTVEVPEVVLATQGLTVRFGGIVAVDGVSIDVGRDEIVGLIGANGAGKTTLMNAIGGFVAASGNVTVMGTDVSRLSPSARARTGLGRTFQTAMLFPELTVRETVQVALEARGRTSFLRSAFYLGGPAERRRAEQVDRRARQPPCRRRHVAVPRRADRRGGPAGGRSLRAPDQAHPPGVGRVDPHHRARHAAHHEHQRSRVLPRDRDGHRPRLPCRGAHRPCRDRFLPRHRRAGDRSIGRCRLVRAGAGTVNGKEAT